MIGYKFGPMNVVQEGKKYYHMEGYWRKSKDDTMVDLNQHPHPWPTEQVDYEWHDRNLFIMKLKSVEKLMEKKGSVIIEGEETQCVLDNQPLGNRTFHLNGMRWHEGYLHYIQHHKVKPTLEFLDRIFLMEVEKESHKMVVPQRIIQRDGLKFLKVETHQLMIMDALMEHGGKKKYYDGPQPEEVRYSEHAGLLDFDHNSLDKIVVSGKTMRMDAYDKEIFLPSNMPEARDYEYIFHTHPPTPNPGGRTYQGILYEFPSLSDIFHFVEHYESGVTQGSLVMTPEGLYNIRKHEFNGEDIDFNETDFFKEMKRLYVQVQREAIQKYGKKIDLDTFYTKVAKDKTAINFLNEHLNKYDLHIDYYPRYKNKANEWVVRTLYLPVFPYE